MKRPIISHLGTGVMALILSVILWAFAYMENQEQLKVEYEVQCSSPEGVSVKIDKPVLTLTVSGPRRLVEVYRNQPRTVLKKQVPPEAVANQGDQGQVNVTITREDINGDKRLEFSDLPAYLTATFSRITTVELPLAFRVIGQPPSGYVVSRERSYVRPSRVSVTGPKDLLNKAAAIYTKDIEITGPWESNWWDAQIVPEIDSQRVTVERTTARIWLAFERKLVSKTFPDVPVKILLPRGYPYNVELKPSTVTVTVEGPQETLETLQAAGITVFAEIEQDDVPTPPDQGYIRKPEVRLPTGASRKAVEPESVQVIITQPQ